MCIGIPMQVRSENGLTALCAGRGEERRVSLLLTGELPVGTWVMVHVDTAIRTLDEAEVPLINDALDALEAAGRGDPFEHLFADLIGREPQLPDHLRETQPVPSRGNA
ncbi:HypC/HybG/HupF family hydrogenase formation chaperone [Skermanella rosea]|uniref:HypC/HybG/HupF family hydrogenase formation chaperone n=1 Tax=Skermanella rosea TaxID=1817965 RepID=UPI0019314C85|nr:HypC/HybG/HupF family hydrogenase formation chaperone [Skermanella rosea]UEM02055.1 HypC/HybG/HupF family hydrogenase formation chaperone [Skermanella rosea]